GDVGLDRATLALGLKVELDPGADHRLHHVADPPGALGGVEALRRERLAPREGEELAGQPRRPVDRIADRLQVPPLAVVGDPGAADQVDRGADDGEEVVEIVGDAAGQLPDRLHLLRLPERLLGAEKLAAALDDLLLQRILEPAQRFLGALALGDVEQGAEHALRLSARAEDDLGAKQQPAPVVAVAAEAELDLEMAVAAGKRLLPGAADALTVLRVVVLTQRIDAAQ